MKRIYVWLPILVVLLFWRLSLNKDETTVFRLPLNDQWTFHAAGDTIRRSAEVPGNVHLDLMRHGLIEDPFVGLNEENAQWVGETDWIYETVFEISGRERAHEQVRLKFEGLDTHALVTLNGFLVLQADNMFRTWTVDVKEFLRVGTNRLHIHFHSSAMEDSLRAAQLDYALPETRAFSRKAPYQSGWDWGPRLVTAGVWRPITLEAWDGPRIDAMQIVQQSLSDERAELLVHLTLNSEIETMAKFSIGLETGETLARRTVPVASGKSTVEIPVKIERPVRWWTHDQGHPHLYSVIVSMKSEDGARDRMEKRIGLRTVEVVQTADSAGASFAIHLNGRPVFMKGANYIPPDSFMPRVTPKHYRALVQSTQAAHMNMLRVWGGGVYEADTFYDLCDEAGILVWQDFMFACAMYPGDSAFVANVRQEAVDNVRRLRHHPAIALWCGNNEVDEAFHNWGWQQSLKWTDAQAAAVWEAYETVFHQTLPEVVAAEHPGAFYWPSSPKTGWGHDEAFQSGDAHYWGVWWGREPFEKYDEKVGRFMTEYGFQGMPSMETMSTFADSADLTLGSPVLKAHQKHPFGDANIAEYMARDFIVPQSFEDYVYVSQCLQARGIGRALEAHRRNKPYCMGTLYWQLNDCWPVTSWSSLEYSGRWKALHYEARRMFAPLALLHQRTENSLSVYLNNDSSRRVSGKLILTLISFTGKVFKTWEQSAAVQGGGNVRLWSENLEDVLAGHEAGTVVLLARFHSEDGKEMHRLIHLARPRDQRLPKAEVDWRIVTTGERSYIELHTNALARYVCLSSGNAHFEDNYFDMAAGETRRIEMTSTLNTPQLEAGLRVRHLAEIR